MCIRFLWFALRDREFNDEAMKDLVYLKNLLQLNNEEFAAILRDRALRIEQ